MANRNDNGIRGPKHRLPAKRRWTLIELARMQAEVNRRRAVRAALEAHPRDYQRLRTGDRHALLPPAPTPDERKSRPTPVD